MNDFKISRSLFFLFITIIFSSCCTQNAIVAHRGAWKKNNLPENSIAALRHAIDLKNAGSEFDVWRTADDSLVINHDAHYNKMLIEETKYVDLVKFKLSNGEKLPTLYEYIIEGKKNNKHTLLVCEIKPSEISKERGKTTALKTVELIKKLKADKNTCYISFDYDILKQIRAVDAKTSLQYLEGNKSPKEVKADKINGIDYHYSVFKKHPEWIKEAKDNKIILNAWTVNETADMDWIINQKFNYITTNEPELLSERLTIKK
ncbi:glycerophosphodiester phosphodiesterase family protein [Flavobacterium reichenbachii]|uniref:Glycerophosphodiester phosphodiesterase n=1 Tax=Flavobacterium reichenbachii TaxID=362418 RepID=A0A085ZMT4_9FLAO|nr:glycerophosphodiester phosphodiesterase family protein [Flavobacterium reichenbachii]KFF05748.1 glycerophosphodiester phosphodiesterase [Flavobacterium reichenbachii]OXB12636.1 glycerophosphodiester phosphodiesterase [Flavobacterium reichenbachii]